MAYTPTSNIANKVRNTRLPRTQPLLPLFEIVSNSIHSIEEARSKSLLADTEGRIVIDCIRMGDPEILSEVKGSLDRYDIISFIVSDNGIGLNEENLKSFIEADTDHKIEIGGKGVGRFVCLKAYNELNIKSFYIDKKETKSIQFNFRPTKEGFHDFMYPEVNGLAHGTTIKLNTIKEEYKKKLPNEIREVALELVSHFQLYFITANAPKIVIRNQNNDEIDLQSLFKSDFKKDVKIGNFIIGEQAFKVYLTKSDEYQSHKLHFCAHNRSVIKEGLYSRIVDLGKKPIKEGDSSFYYQAHVVSNILDDNVDTERIGFNFPDDEDDDEDTVDINLAKIRRNSLSTIEDLLSDYLGNARTLKVESYKPIIYDRLPQYRSLLKYKEKEIRNLPPNLSEEELDVELYKIESEWRLEVKKEKITLLSENKDVTTMADYQLKYEKFLSEFNDIGKSDLARYVVHRKTIIELLESLIESTEFGKFENEELIHSVFFPIRTNSDEVPYDKQNLWLIDERLTYHSFLASDKTYNNINQVSSGSTDRTDLLIYNEAFAFSDSKAAPHSSFTIVEFKKPERNDYHDYDDSKNPIEQAEKYIEQLLDGKVTGRNGRHVEVTKNTPFYVYIVCDIRPSLKKILQRREFENTPDGKGWFKVKSKHYSAYIEVLPFEKVLDDAKKRNRILFEKLKI
ncbi:ATP-binding protein [Sphingobacterium siyangense]|uniref:ATP-binding protein n=1 Tax=Sphingobacterium siyangense TaxID=459529 RepID=UPI003DA38529